MAKLYMTTEPPGIDFICKIHSYQETTITKLMLDENADYVFKRHILSLLPSVRMVNMHVQLGDALMHRVLPSLGFIKHNIIAFRSLPG